MTLIAKDLNIHTYKLDLKYNVTNTNTLENYELIFSRVLNMSTSNP